MPDRAVVDIPSFGRTVQRARIEKGIYIWQAAQALGMTPAELSSVERNDTPISHEKAVQWARYLGLRDIDVPMPALQPRALVALSDDAKWLVALDADAIRPRGVEGPRSFTIYEHEYVGSVFPVSTFTAREWQEDTGQDAHEVLREWMAGREG